MHVAAGVADVVVALVYDCAGVVVVVCVHDAAGVAVASTFVDNATVIILPLCMFLPVLLLLLHLFVVVV